MGSILNKFGVTKQLLNNDALYEKLDGDSGLASLASIEAVVNKLAPVQCGLPLIRIGPKRDGGYLVPNDLQGIEACFSPGTNNFKDFEDHLSNNYGIKAFMCDYSSDVEKFRTPLINGLQFFEKKWLDIEENDITLDINKWVGINTASDSDLILQMDIEGAEYRNLLNASPETLSRFRIIVLEIHDLKLLSRVEFLEGVFVPVLDRLSDLFGLVHVHPNNIAGKTMFGEKLAVPNLLEITFLRKDRFTTQKVPLALPHQLDAINVAAKPPLHLDGVFLKNADSVQSEINSLKQTVQWLENKYEDVSKKLAHSGLLAEAVSFLVSMTSSDKNIAKGKLASQSSISAFTTPEGAGGAVNGNKTGKFGFHTGIEVNPWWSVDLGDDYDLDGVLVYNRLDNCQERIRTLRILISVDQIDWVVVYNHNYRPPFGGVRPFNGVPPLLVPLNRLKARFVKLELLEKTVLHLDQVEIFGVPSVR